MQNLFLYFIFSLLVSGFTQAQEQSAAIQDGIQTEISAEELESLKAWAENTKKELDFFKVRLESMSDRNDILDYYQTEVNEIIEGSTGINALAMRKFLNRARELGNLVNGRRSKKKAFRLALYKVMVERAADFFQSDIEFIQNKTRDEKAFIRSSFETLEYLKTIAKDRDTKISDSEIFEVEKKYIAFINIDLINSSFRTRIAFEIGKIDEVLSDNDLGKEQLKMELSYLIKNVLNAIGLSQISDGKERATISKTEPRKTEQNESFRADTRPRRAEYTTNRSESCASGYVSGLIYKTDRGRSTTKICLLESRLPNVYRTSSGSSCASGYIEGVRYKTDRGRFTSKNCLLISSLGSDYITNSRTHCAQGYIDGQTFRTDRGRFTSKKCLRL